MNSPLIEQDVKNKIFNWQKFLVKTVLKIIVSAIVKVIVLKLFLDKLK